MATLPAVLPWNSVERLRDHFGDYVIVVTCRACRHSREMTPAFLARHCRCGKKLVDVQLGFNRKPRGWVKNPS